MWSVGIIMFEVGTGKTLFWGERTCSHSIASRVMGHENLELQTTSIFEGQPLKRRPFLKQNKGHLGSRYLHERLISMVNVGKYTSPMDGKGGSPFLRV